MYKLFTLCCSLLLGLSACTGQTKRKVTATDNKSLLWKISGKGLKQPSYLFGTIHMICPSDYVWTPAMQKALDAAGKVAFELDMDDPSMQMEVAMGMMMKDGRKLKDFYTEEEYTRLADGFGEQGELTLNAMQQMKPFAVMSMLALKAVNCSMPNSYEGNIMALVQKGNKNVEIVGLESISDQIHVFDQMNTDSTAQQLLEMADKIDSLKIQYNEMVNAYKTQDLPALYQLIIESPDYKNDLNTLLFDRNEKWIPIISRMAAAQTAFIAVGAGHLWGNKGVIQLLKDAGYTVEPVK